MNGLELFTYQDAQLRTLLIDGEPWFVAADALALLDLARSSAALLDEDEKGVHAMDTPGGVQQVSVITESGLYSLILRSRKDEARAIKRWITREVLPTIRKTGSYASAPAIPQTYAEALRAAADQCERAELAEKARVEAEAHAKALEAPASAWKHLADSQGDYEVADAAKVLSRDPNINIGRDRLFSFMAAEGWVYRNRSTSRWKAYQTQIDCGRLSEKFGKPFLHEPSGQMRLSDPTIRVTPKGIEELHKRLGGSGQLPLVAAS